MKILIGIISLCLLAGCASSKAIYKNYDELVHINDGISEQEAKIMAQRMLINTVEKDSYRLTAPDVKTNMAALKYPNYWFVVFGHNWFSPISSNPLAGTYTELRETEYLVVINKTTGKMPFFGQWYPKRENGFDWIFDMEGFHQKNGPLALPPGEQSKQLF